MSSMHLAESNYLFIQRGKCSISECLYSLLALLVSVIFSCIKIF